MTEPICSTEAPCLPRLFALVRAALPNLAVFDQGGACGAAGPASAPGSALGGPPSARRATTHNGTRTVQLTRQARLGTAHSRLPRHPIVQLAVTTSMEALRAVAYDRLPDATLEYTRCQVRNCWTVVCAKKVSKIFYSSGIVSCIEFGYCQGIRPLVVVATSGCKNLQAALSVH